MPTERSDVADWMLMENSHEVPDRVQAMIEQRQIWEKMVLQALKSRG